MTGRQFMEWEWGWIDREIALASTRVEGWMVEDKTEIPFFVHFCTLSFLSPIYLYRIYLINVNFEKA